jgi:hypothetical protein
MFHGSYLLRDILFLEAQIHLPRYPMRQNNHGSGGLRNSDRLLISNLVLPTESGSQSKRAEFSLATVTVVQYHPELHTHISQFFNR